MTEIYFVRHCETLANIEGTLAGWLDTDISERGARQLECLAERFGDIHIDVMYATRLKRAVLTAEAMNSGSHVPIITDDRFLEIGLGSYEHLAIQDLPKEELYNWDYAPHLFGSPDAERMTDVQRRGYEALVEAAEKNSGKVIGIGSHGGCIKAVMTKVYGYPVEEMVKVPWTRNTAVTHLFYDEDRKAFTVDYYNDISHLPEDLRSGRVEDWGK